MDKSNLINLMNGVLVGVKMTMMSKKAEICFIRHFCWDIYFMFTCVILSSSHNPHISLSHMNNVWYKMQQKYFTVLSLQLCLITLSEGVACVHKQQTVSTQYSTPQEIIQKYTFCCTILYNHIVPYMSWKSYKTLVIWCCDSDLNTW